MIPALAMGDVCSDPVYILNTMQVRDCLIDYLIDWLIDGFNVIFEKTIYGYCFQVDKANGTIDKHIIYLKLK